MLEWARQHFVRNATNALEHKQKHTLRDEYQIENVWQTEHLS